MNILQYNDLRPGRLQKAFDQAIEHLRAGNFRAADVKKLNKSAFYRAKLSNADRLLFKFGHYRGETQLLLLEIIEHHAYETSRFLDGAAIDESKLVSVPGPDAVPAADKESLPYVHRKASHFHLLDKIISFDEFQSEAFKQRPPLILIGSAGSGKTALALEKTKLLEGDILYLTLSSYLAEHARNLYYSNRYENEGQNPDFLSLREFIESLRVPEGRPVTFRAFAGWFGRHRHSYPIKDAHMLFEEFNGVLTGASIDCSFLSREAYMNLGVRRSVFTDDQRPLVYDIFEKYRRWMADEGLFDLNTAAFNHLDLVRPAYDFAVIDEVQDLTNIQVHLALKALRDPLCFILSGDANQIVHPNFFSWAGIKTMFYERRAGGRAEILRVLDGNFRNSPEITGAANRLLLVKNARFGSIDRESNYLVRAVSENRGAIELMEDSEKTRRDFNARTERSTRFAVLVMREEDKQEARRLFKTPLLFSIQEAKGLEYENVVLVGFVSGARREFNAIVEGVEPADVERERLDYARAKDKADKSLDAYKFFINALYVGITRAVRNLYWIESDIGHRLFRLLDLKVKSHAAIVNAGVSSLDEWREEARKLDLQGKEEQAEAIRRTILGAQPVPWKIITPDTLEDLKKEALDPGRFNKQAKQLLYEYALVYSVPYVFDELLKHKFTRAADPDRDRPAAERKYFMEYQEKSLNEVKRKIDRHGMDFRNPLNQTPLMIAAKMGLTEFVGWLIRGGADPNARDNWGRIPLQIALRQAFLDRAYARAGLGPVFDSLAPSHIKVKIDDRMIKIDRISMEFFLLHSMMALFQEILRVKIVRDIPAFETGDFVHALEHFPEPVIPGRRRKRQYISSVLARNEVFRVGPYNRKLFVRVCRGFYLPNPTMAVEVAEKWVNVYDLLRTDILAREKQNDNLLRVLKMLDTIKEDIRKTAQTPGAPQAGSDPVPASAETS